MSFRGGADLNTVVVSEGGGLDIAGYGEENEKPHIDNLIIENGMFAFSVDMDIASCTVGESGYIHHGGESTYDFDSGTWTQLENAYINIGTLTLTDEVLAIEPAEYKQVSDVVLTTTSFIDEDMLLNRWDQGELGLSVVKNEDNTYSVVWCENADINYTLSYGETTKTFIAINDAIAYIDELNNAEEEYTIYVEPEHIEASSDIIGINRLPEKAKKLTIKGSEIYSNTAVMLFDITGGCPTEYVDWKYVKLSNCDLGEVTALEVNEVDVLKATTIDKLTLGTGTKVSASDELRVDDLVYTKTSADNSNMWLVKSAVADTYGTIRIGKVTLATSKQKINLNVMESIKEVSPIFTLDEVADVWDNIVVDTQYLEALGGTIEGYSIKARNTESGSYAYVWEADGATEFELQYDSTIEKFSTVEDAIARIDEINNADNDYTISLTDAGDLGGAPNWNGYISDFPETARSLKITKSCSTDITFNLRDSDGIIGYPVIFEDVHLYFECDLQTKDLTINNGGLVYIWYELNVDGILLLKNTQIDAFEPITATTLSLDVNEAIAEHLILRSGMVVDNLEIPTKQTAKVGLCNKEESVLIVNNATTDLNRVVVVSKDQGYEGASKIGEEGCHIFYVKEIVPNYYVTDSEGNTFINTRSWIELENAFDDFGDTAETYTIKVANNQVIGTLPSQAAKIILVGDEEVGIPIIKNSSATLTVPVELEIQNATLVYGSEEETVNIKLNGKTLTLDNVYNIGTLTGGNGNVLVKSNADAVKVDKLKSIVIEEGCALVVMDSVTNVASIRLDGSLYAWGNITIENILCDEEGELCYNIDKKLTINGTVTFDEGADPESASIVLRPLQNYQIITAIAKDVVVVDVCGKADVSDFTVAIEDNPYVLYRSKTALKTGVPSITVFENYYGDWTTADASEGVQFATINDAIVHVNEETEGTFVIRLEQDITTTETLKTIQGTADKTVLITPAGDDMATLTFKGTFVVDGTNVEIMNVDLRNSAKANASVTLKNGANIALSGTAVNALTVPAGTSVTIANLDSADVDVVINGTAKCAGEVIMADNAVLWCRSTLTTGDFTLNGEYAEVRIITGKAFTINGNVNIGEDSLVCINRVDKEGNLATIKAGTAMVTAENAVAGQFYTQNIMTGTEDVSWLLTKSGKVIKTAGLVAYAYVSGERGEFNPQFASFNEAKEYVAAQADGKEYVIELLSDSKGADLTDLPENLIAIVKSESATATSVKLTTSLDVTLSTNLVLDGVNLSAAKKTIYANDYELYVDNNGGITAARAKELDTINVNSGTVTFTAKDSTINYIEMGPDGTFKCPQFTGYAMG